MSLNKKPTPSSANPSEYNSLDSSEVTVRSSIDPVELQLRMEMRMLEQGDAIADAELHLLGRGEVNPFLAFAGDEFATNPFSFVDEDPHRLLANASRQAERLTSQVRAAVYWILTANAAEARRWWDRWLPELRGFLVHLSSFQEQQQRNAGHKTFDHEFLCQHAHQIATLVCQGEVMLMQYEDDWMPTGAVCFSDLLEQDVLPWLRLLDRFLKQMNEQPERN